MERNCSLDEISDGRLYELNDMVKADCGDCKGCFECCKGMGNSIILDPYDIYRLEKGLKLSFEQLINSRIELNVVDGIILPNLILDKKSDKCSFLDNNGRCSIHELRPGICRIFPLGRYYEGNSFKYILQINECIKQNRSKIKVKKWIDTDNIKDNQKFIIDWHYFLKAIEEKIKMEYDDSKIKDVNIYILNKFYINKYGENFYELFNRRLIEAKKELGL